MTKHIIYLFLFLLLLTDLSYSFVQHLSQPLDGDMAWNIIPSNDVKPILENPLGINAILKDKTYANPNRFFCHWSFREYFLSAPLFLQNFTEPINSIYLSCAISKIIIQIILIILLAMAISGTNNILKMDFIIAAILVSPLFQTNGYRTYMGIIDPSITYTFFYALPCAILLLYFSPFIRQFYHKKNLSSKIFFKILWLPLSIIVCLSGPLNPGIVLVFSMLLMLSNIRTNYLNLNQAGITKKIISATKMIPANYWFFLVPVSLLSFYSLFLGRYNSITISTLIPLREMYLKLPQGIYYQFTQKLGFPVLFIILTINTIIINKKFKTQEGKKILNIFKWIGIFSLCYILLLPLGGYREYRPNILRYDTIMPITLSLIFIFGSSTLFLLKSLSKKQKIWYVPVIFIVLLIYTNADKAKFNNNKCEKIALKEISESKNSIVELHNDCNVLSWDKVTEAENSDLNAQLLNIWGITKEKKLYYNK
ncbi:MAG: hypothetical protein KAG95_01925 [Bacteroidales bacterium]|nr:hypothetical protein [Bacteroidales bacterium]